MEQQSTTPNGLPQIKPNATGEKRKLPTPKELISHYESQGMDTEEASIKVIEDLQNALYRVISSGRAKKDRLLTDSSRKLDATNNRLAIIDLKLDSKPGYAESFGIGLASGAALKGIATVWPHVLGAVGNIWSSAKSVTEHSP